LIGCSKKATPAPPLYDTSDAIFNEPFNLKLSLQPNETLLFIGDSITDARRDKQIALPNITEGLGYGYVRNIADYLLPKEEYKNLSIYNRGVSGNRTVDLANRWAQDCLNLKPDVISILVGINDLNYNVTASDFYKNFRNILNTTRTLLPNARVVICEPFLLPNIANYAKLQETFHEFRKIVRILSKDFKTVFIPYYQHFVNMSKDNSPSDWLSDGVHPTAAGISLLSSVWEQYLQQ
jgi:lysophospholipase L1-like esterase